MNEVESEDGMIDTDLLWRSLADLEAGDLDLEQRDQLMALLGRSPAAQRVYLDYFEMAALLESEAAIHAEQGRLPVVFGQRRMANRLLRRSLLAAVLMISAIAAALYMVKQADVPVLAASSTAGAQWAVDGVVRGSTADHGNVAAGASVKVWSGMVALELGSGATYVIQGPGHVSFPRLNRPLLHEGLLWIDSDEPDESHESLVVETAELRVRDIGTRFAVRVSGGGPAEVHLVEGKVEVFGKSANKLLAALEPEERGFEISVTGESNVLPLARDPFPELSNLLQASENYPTTVLSQNPVGYWRMNEKEAGFLSNEVSGALVGRRHPKVAMQDSGPDPAIGFQGFDEGNRSALIPEMTSRIPISLGTPPVHDGILFADDFSEEGGTLHGATPDITTNSAKWLSNSAFNRDGSTNRSKGSANLPFTPLDGVIYTLDATVTTGTGPSEDWIGLGFGRLQGDGFWRFGTRGMRGCAWMLHRAADATKPVNRTWLSTKASDWDWPSGSALGGAMDMRIVLDTTGGAGAWTATWYAKRPVDEAYTKVRDTEQLMNESISCVAVSVIGDRLTASVDRFSLRADKKDIVLPNRHLADGAARVRRKEGAVSFWVQREPGGKGSEVLWAAGENAIDASIYAHLTEDGRAGFFMENGRYDVLVASAGPINDGKWHHLVASWNSTSVDLFVDGMHVARDTEFRGEQQGALPELRFGGGGVGSDFTRFTGCLDEIAVWDRPLTNAEVIHQFRSAQGK